MHKKVRNIQEKYKKLFAFNIAVIVIVLAAANFALPESGPIGNRTMTVFFILDGIVMMTFMCLLEKYRITISGLYNETVITVLSSIYTFAVMSFINLVFFSWEQKLIADVLVAAAKTVAVFLTDFTLDRVYKGCRKPKILILDYDSRNFNRMKKIKYTILKYYDSWYENLENVSEEELKEFIAEEYPKYDAVCILDDMKDEQYKIAVNGAMERDMDLFVVPKIVDAGRGKAQTVFFDDVMTLYMPKKTLTKPECFCKRVIDIAVSLAGLIVAGVPMAIIAAAIKITSPGPVFYKQERLTKGRRKFEIYKFRTMIPDAEKLSGPKFAEKDDPRITPIGKILRSSRLDELPQLINVLKGDMSLVGPRPERPVFAQKFEREIENYSYRYEVRGGLTSLSHVYGRYSTYIHDRTYYDLYYIMNYSLLLDLKIILLTTKVMFLKSSAEGEDDLKEKTVADRKEEATV